MDLPLVLPGKRKVLKNPVNYVLCFKYTSCWLLGCLGVFLFVFGVFLSFIILFKLFYIFYTEEHSSQIYWVSHWKIFGLIAQIEIFEEEIYAAQKYKHHFVKYKKYRNNAQCRALSAVLEWCPKNIFFIMDIWIPRENNTRLLFKKIF